LSTERAASIGMTKRMNKEVLVVGISMLVACAATLYCHFIVGSDILSPHLYYLPIMLAAIWWERRGWFVSTFACAFLLAAHLISGVEAPLTADLARGATFLLVGGVAAELSRARSLAREALRSSRAQQNGLMGSMLDGVIIAYPDGTIRVMNETALELLGYAEQDIVGQSIGTIIGEEGREDPFGITDLRQLVQEEEASRAGLTLLAKSGERIPIVFSGSVIRNDEGGFGGILSVVRDVREPQRLMDEILRAEATFRALNAAALAVQIVLEPKDVFKAVGSELTSLGFHSVILLLDEDKENLTIPYMSWGLRLIGAAEELLGFSRHTKFPLDRMPECIRSVLENRTTVFSQGNERIEEFLPARARGLAGKLAEILGLEKGILAPLVAGGEIVGALGVDSRELTESDALAVTAFANHVSIAIENAGLFEHARLEIAERRQAEEQIQASLQEKEVCLKEVQHRVKNNLQVLSSLLDLAAEHTEDRRAIETLIESQNRIRSMALVHEQLYRSETLTRIDFAAYIKTLATQLFHSCGVNQDTITLKINADDVVLSVETAIPCGLIINELVSNSLRHALPAGRACSEQSESKGEIRIDLHSYDDELILIISDNGIGFPQDLDFRNTESLGLRLVDMLARQLEGTIELDRNGGTTFKIAIPRQHPQ